MTGRRGADDDPVRIGGDLVDKVAAIAAKQDPTRRAPEPVPVDVEAERRAMLRERWNDMVPRRLGDPTLANVDPAAAEALGAWSESPDRNVIVTGPVGVGKSYAGFAALRGPFGRGVAVAAVNVPRLLADLRPDGAGADMARLVSVDLLLLDDLGAERPTDWTTEQVYRLVNDRWEAERPTIATSNLPLTGDGAVLADVIGERVYSRLVHGALAIRLTGADRRRTTTNPRSTP